MSERKPSLKLKFKSGPSAIKQEPIESPSLNTPSISAPKLKINVGSNKSPQTLASQSLPLASTSAPSTTKAKPARKPKPTPKKRALEVDLSGDDDDENTASVSTSQPQKIKLTARAPTTPRILLRAEGKPPTRPRGVGYDSEASDREIDPTISESITLRMAPGPDCDTLRKAISENNIGSRKTGGVDVRIRFLRTDCRRAVVTINGRHYAACMVDLPCVIEAMKSWFPKSGWIKSADICQMLIVLGPIQAEEEALTYPLPGVGKGELDEKTFQYAHGLTPPMRWVRRRRFRRRISVRTVMEVEEEVERLLQADEEAEGESKFELIDECKLERESEQDSEDLYDVGEEDAEGEEEDDDQSQFIQTVEGVPEEDEEEAAARLAAEMEAGMMDDFDDDPSGNAPEILTSAGLVTDSPAALDTATPPSTAETPIGLTPSAAATPAPAIDTSSTADDDESGEESDEDEEVDEDQLEKQQDLQRQREEIADLETAIRTVQEQLAKQGNPLLRKRLLDKIQDLQRDLELKMSAVSGGGKE